MKGVYMNSIRKGDKLYFSGKDGLQRIWIIGKDKYGLAKVDDKDRVVKGYEGIINFFSHLVLGRNLTDQERTLWYYNGYYPKIGININDKVYLFDRYKLEDVEDHRNTIYIKYNLGDNKFRDIETLEFPLEKYGYIELGDIILLFDINKVKFEGINIFDNRQQERGDVL